MYVNFPPLATIRCAPYPLLACDLIYEPKKFWNLLFSIWFLAASGSFLILSNKTGRNYLINDRRIFKLLGIIL